MVSDTKPQIKKPHHNKTRSHSMKKHRNFWLNKVKCYNNNSNNSIQDETFVDSSDIRQK